MTETMKALAKQMLNWADAERATLAVKQLTIDEALDHCDDDDDDDPDTETAKTQKQ